MRKILWRCRRTRISMDRRNSFRSSHNSFTHKFLINIFQRFEHDGIITSMVFGVNLDHYVCRRWILLILSSYITLWTCIRQFWALDKLAWHVIPGYNRRRCNHACIWVHGQCWFVLREYIPRRSVWNVSLLRGCQCVRRLRQHLLWLPGRIPGHILWLYYCRFNRQGPWGSSLVDPRYCTRRRLSDWNSHPEMDHGWWLWTAWH